MAGTRGFFCWCRDKIDQPFSSSIGVPSVACPVPPGNLTSTGGATQGQCHVLSSMALRGSISQIHRVSIVLLQVTDIRITSNYTNDDLLSMKQPRLKISSSGIDSFGLHHFLKVSFLLNFLTHPLQQWYSNQRTIEEVTISSTRPLSVDRIVYDLPVSVLYTPLHHEDSLLKVLEPNQNRESVFVMMKPGDIRNVYILKIDFNSITVERSDNPASYLTSRLSCPEYELVTGRCKACDFPMYFCFHHRSLASLLMYTFE